MSLISSIISPEYRVQQWMITDEKGNSILPIKSILSLAVTSGGSVVADAIEKGSFTRTTKQRNLLKSIWKLGLKVRIGN